MAVARALGAAAVLAVVLAALPGIAHAAVVQHDSSAVCVAALPACEARCKGQDFFFVCAADSGLQGAPYAVCRCADTAPPVGGGSQVASLALDPQSGWPGAAACNQKTWANDCASRLTAIVNGTSVFFAPALRNAFNEQCNPAPGLVLGPKGTQAAVVFPQYPIGLTSTAPDGTVTVDFSANAADDPNGKDWSACRLVYKITEGTFLNTPGGAAAAAAAGAAPATEEAVRRQPAAGGANSAGGGRGGAVATLAAAAAAAAALVTVLAT